MGTRRHDAQADRRQQGLFVMVAEALDPARPFQDPVRGGRDPDGSAGDARCHAQIRADREMPLAARRQDRRLGVARDHGICRGGLSREGDLAEGQGGAGARPFARQRDARRLHRAEAGLPDQFPPQGAGDPAQRRSPRRRRADRGGLGACAPDLRPGRTVPVRPLLRRGRDVRARRQPLPRLRHSRSRSRPAPTWRR